MQFRVQANGIYTSEIGISETGFSAAEESDGITERHICTHIDLSIGL
jgi:hypothetical protein